MEKLLTKFLEVNLLPQLETNEQFSHIESAIGEINRILAKNRMNLIGYTLAALQSDVSKDDAVIKEVDQALKKHWKTVQNNISDEPRQIWRTIIWEALNLQAKDTVSSAVIWLTAASYFPHSELDPNERRVITEFLLFLRNKVETEAKTLWYQPNQAEPQNLELNFSLKKPEIKNAIDGAFKQDLVKAAGPNDASGSSLEGANPNWANADHVWSDAFAERASKAIGKRIITSAINLRDDLYSQLEESLNELNDELSQFSQKVLTQQTHRNLRNELLWWRQTLYSPILQKGYRNLDPFVAAFTIANDLHRLLDGIYPTSVEFLMQEVFRAAEIEDAGKKFTIKLIVEKLVADDGSKIVDNSTGGYYKAISNPAPLAAIVKKSINSDRVAEEELDLLGLKSGTEITLPEFSVWIFRDLQAHCLANKK